MKRQQSRLTLMSNEDKLVMSYGEPWRLFRKTLEDLNDRTLPHLV
jgi:hypothetical protein